MSPTLRSTFPEGELTSKHLQAKTDRARDCALHHAGTAASKTFQAFDSTVRALFVAAILLCIAAANVRGAVYNVTLLTDNGAIDQGQSANATSGDLRWCIVQANANPGSTIVSASFGGGANTFRLQNALPPITTAMTLQVQQGAGSDDVIDAQGNGRIFFIDAPGQTVSIAYWKLRNGHARGGHGGSTTFGGGAGAGLGGGIFVNAGNLFLTSVTFSNCAATGGNGGGVISGGDGFGGGGGGLGGSGGGGTFGGGAGGGGYQGNGGSGNVSSFYSGGGGGGGIYAPGGSAPTSGGGGGGAVTAGGNGTGGTGGAGGNNSQGIKAGGDGGNITVNGQTGSLYGGGGGGGGPFNATPAAHGGAGGRYGGGGGGRNGGNGGDFGGGGAGSAWQANGTGGNGGFGGGGGGSPSVGGSAGFGGGGGSGNNNNFGSGAGPFGGNGYGNINYGNGGGGAALGGTIFVRADNGASLSAMDSPIVTLGTLTAGIGGPNTQVSKAGGQTSGTAFFLLGGTTRLTVNNNQTISGTIGGWSGSPAALVKSGSGTLTLAGANTYGGGTTISNGTVQVSGAGTLGDPNGSLLLVSGANLTLNGVPVSVGAFNGPGGLVYDSSSTPTTFTVGLGNASGSFSGVLFDGAGKLGFTKTGAGTQTLTGQNLYTGPTLIDGGTLVIPFFASLANTPVTIWPGATLVNGGTIAGSVSVSGTYDGTGTLNGPLTVNPDGLVTKSTVGAMVLKGAVTNNGTMRFIGSGTLNASAATQFVNNGILDLINGSATLPTNFVNGVTGRVLTASSIIVKSVTRSNAIVTVKADSYTGHTFQLQRASVTTPAGFSNMGASQPGITGSVLSFVDTNAVADVSYYRVFVNP